MCIFAYSPNNVEIPEQKIIQMYENNNDGFGIAVTGENIYYEKGIFSIEKILGLYRKFKKYKAGLLLHFRTASSSGIGNNSICNDYSHPFTIGKNFIFGFNGNLYHFSNLLPGREQSKVPDSQVFLDEILLKLPSNFLYNAEILDALEDYCVDNFTKMILLSPDKCVILNERLGEWENDVYYSNKGLQNYYGYGYSGAYEYNGGDVRHKGGLLTLQYLPEHKRKIWQRCKVCRGYFKNIDEICNSCKKYLNLKEFTNERN